MLKRSGWLVALTIGCVLAAILLPPVSQPIAYHDFADHRHLLGVANFLDVVSNVGFLGAGIAGLWVVARPRTRFEFPVERWPYAVFFLGLVLTAVGSAYYHLAPDNSRLVWDRLPMTVAFMALLSSQIVDRISVRTGLVLLVPMLLVGAGTVIYWDLTEQAGRGNVVPYAILQGYTVVILLLVAILCPSRYTRGSDLYYIFAWYVLSKILETFDHEIFTLGHALSGHTLKHLAAASSGFVACRMLALRTLERPLAARDTTPAPGDGANA